MHQTTAKHQDFMNQQFVQLITLITRKHFHCGKTVPEGILPCGGLGERDVLILLDVVCGEGLEKAARPFSLACSGGLLKMLGCSFHIQKLFCCLQW